MKQYITKEQWVELTDEEKAVFIGKIYRYEAPRGYNIVEMRLPEPAPSIGQMLEFLETDKYFISIENYRGSCYTDFHENTSTEVRNKHYEEIELEYGSSMGGTGFKIEISKDKNKFEIKRHILCDALWEAVKTKIKNL